MLERLKKARRLKRYGVRSPLMVLTEAKAAGLPPEFALAMLENETGIPQRNVFGCDHGSTSNVPWCGQEVTRSRVRALLDSPYSNGVGWTQLTYKPLVREADWAGGAHKPRYQMRIGFRHLASLQKALGERNGFRAYNGIGPAAEAYADRALAHAVKWRRILKGRNT